MNPPCDGPSLCSNQPGLVAAPPWLYCRHAAGGPPGADGAAAAAEDEVSMLRCALMLGMLGWNLGKIRTLRAESGEQAMAR